jgi:hypothetical protein
LYASEREGERGKKERERERGNKERENEEERKKEATREERERKSSRAQKLADTSLDNILDLGSGRHVSHFEMKHFIEGARQLLFFIGL